MAARKSNKKSTRSKSPLTDRLSGLFNRQKPKTPANKKKGKAAAAEETGGLSLDRKLDIVGVALALVGFLTLFSLLSASQTGLGSMWVGLWRRALGWGVYIFPLALIGIGIWLVARNFESVPTPHIERLLGLIILFLILLTLMHMTAAPVEKAASQQIAEAGGGGGKIGSWVMLTLIGGLGVPGAVVVILAGIVISLTLILDVSVVDLFRWVPGVVLKLQDAWDERRAARQAARRDQTGRIPPPTDHEPLVPPPSGAQAAAQQAAGRDPDGQPLSPLAQALTERRDWILPEVNTILEAGGEVNFDDEYDRKRAQLIEETLASFGAPSHVVEINRGPTITQYGVEPDFIESSRGRTRVRVNKIAALADDLSLALAAQRIRIQAPVPGKGFVGIEVPNEEIAVVAMRDVIENPAFKRMRSPLKFALGQDVAGNAVAADLSGMPHLLVAGATGSGKSVCVNSIITCLMLHNTPETMRFIMVDPKRVELTGYNGIPHLLAPVVTEIDRVVGVLQWVTREMDSRYQKFADIGARNINDYNARITADGSPMLPYLVLVIDELADMMMVAPDQTERLITRMAQLARATGIHLVISTQRPSVDVVTGLIKANFPARIAFAVASGTDSRVILDQPGAERLLGRGDMLFQAPDAPSPVRLQGVFVSDPEILRAVQYWRAFAGTTSMAPVPTGTPREAIPNGVPLKQIPIWDEMQEEENQDPIYQEALELVRRRQRASISMLQRRLRVGYTRAARLIEQMEEEGIVGPPTEGSKPREVLDYGEEEEAS